MPRVLRRPHDRNKGYTDADVRHLQTGCGFFVTFGRRDEFAVTQEDVADAWAELRDDLLPPWIADHPGTRPWAWWAFTAPERRRRTDGRPHPFDNPERDEHIRRTSPNPAFAEATLAEARELSFGCPRLWHVPDDFAATYETQPVYLLRLHLVDEAERAALDDPDTFARAQAWSMHPGKIRRRIP